MNVFKLIHHKLQQYTNLNTYYKYLRFWSGLLITVFLVATVVILIIFGVQPA